MEVWMTYAIITEFNHIDNGYQLISQERRAWLRGGFNVPLNHVPHNRGFPNTQELQVVHERRRTVRFR